MTVEEGDVALLLDLVMTNLPISRQCVVLQLAARGADAAPFRTI